MSPNNIHEMLHGKRPFIRPLRKTSPSPIATEKPAEDPVITQFKVLQPEDEGDHKEIVGVRFVESPREGWVKCGMVQLILVRKRRIIAAHVWVDPTSLGSIGQNDESSAGVLCTPTTAWGVSKAQYDPAHREVPSVLVMFEDVNDYEPAMTALDPIWKERKNGRRI